MENRFPAQAFQSLYDRPDRKLHQDALLDGTVLIKLCKNVLKNLVKK